MQIEPAPEAFAATYAHGEPQVVWTTLVADLETPVSAFLKVAGGRPMSFLLESVEGGAVRGRYSIIGLEPDLIWRARGSVAEINRTARSSPQTFAPCAEPPLVKPAGQRLSPLCCVSACSWCLRRLSRRSPDRPAASTP